MVDGEALRRTVGEILDENWSGDHTVPSRTLYPHQWSWDAGFIAIGLAHHAPERAWRDLESLFAAQWTDGRVPHIVFDPGVTDRDYFPGPAFWAARAPNGRETTGVVQPPVHALAAWEIFNRTPTAARDQARARLRALYPRLKSQQSYLSGSRDVGDGGLASLVHPWESGLDNSPSWDEALAGVPVDPHVLDGHPRRDNQVAAAAHRPTDQDYARYIAIAAAYRDGGYRDADLADRHPFLVECPAFNAIRAAAEHALARIAPEVDADPAPHEERAAQITAALVDRLFDSGTGMFHALDVRTGKRSPARCVNGLVPLILPGLPEPVARCLVAEAGSARFGLPVPSYDRTAPDFDPLRYWRGPTWININWLLYRGLLAHGYRAVAADLRRDVLALVERSGCYEYFDPDTGAGIGSADFSWTASLALDLLEN